MKPINEEEFIEICKNSQTAAEAARKLNIKHQSIIACLKGKNRTAGGFKWKYKKPIDSKN